MTYNFTESGRPVLRDRFTALCLLLAGSAANQCTPFKDDAAGEADAGRTPADGGGGAPSDANSSGVGAEGAGSCDVSKPFGAPLPVFSQSGTLYWTADLRLSADYVTAYFRGGPRGATTGTDLRVATRPAIDAPLGEIGVLADIGCDTPDQESPTVTGDGLSLVFSRSSSGVFRLFHATRASTTTPFRYAGPIFDGSPGDDQTAFFREDGHALYFASSRIAARGDDIYVSGTDGSHFGPAIAIEELNTTSNEVAPVVTPDDLTIYFASDREGPNNLDIWTATRASRQEPFSQPRSVTELNTPDIDVPTFVTRDGCTLYFSSNRDRAPDTVYVATKPPR